MIEIYGRPNCGYCTAAVNVCEDYHLKYTYNTIESSKQLEEISERVGQELKTVPQIFWHNKYIGGYTELVREIENTRSYGQEKF